MLRPGPVGVPDLSGDLVVGQSGFLEVYDSSVAFGGCWGYLLDVATLALRVVLRGMGVGESPLQPCSADVIDEECAG